MNYNIIEKDISNGLDANQVNSLGSGDYLILRYAPEGANVKIRINDANAKDISMIQDDSITATGINRIYISADPVPDEHIIFAQSSNDADFKINPAPALKTVNVNGSFTPRFDEEYTIASGESFDLDVKAIKAVRFLASDYVNISLNTSSIKYEMLEDLIYTTELTNLKFSNDTAASISVIIWGM
ncbi:hypothetical protein [Sulfurospirillum sp. 1612]|uniref:hypothetical protein n=1 Tax=Sulfurospirillum sp. 1612 TaxID=3094835 RepID=UPI002F949F00